MIKFNDISEKYAEAKQQLIAVQLELDESEAKASDLRREREAAHEELERLIELEQSDHISRVLNGEESAPKKPKRLTRIANLREAVAGIDLALPIHRHRVEDARERLTLAREEASQAVLPDILAQKVAAFERCAEPLEKLVDALIEAAAVDLLQEQFAKADGTLRISGNIDREKLFSARVILDRFKKSLPPRFAALAENSLVDADHQIALRAKSFASQIGA